MKEEDKKLKVIPCRKENQGRIYSNYIEVSKTPTDISIKFCDIKPPENEKEIESVKKSGEIRIPIESEVVIPTPVAKDFLNALKEQLKIKTKEKK